MKILFEDNNIIVLVKPVGIVSQSGEKGQKCVQDILGKEVCCVHRLDKDVSGVMVYAKNKTAAALLSKQIRDKAFSKEYLAVINGNPENKKGRFDDLLYHDRQKNKTYIVKKERRGVKCAALEYEVLETKGKFSFVKIKLLTGRTHQIRVQFASRKMPLFADRKYGGKNEGNIGLFCREISFYDIRTQEPVKFSADPEKDLLPWNIF